jgi:hypothetical protein
LPSQRCRVPLSIHRKKIVLRRRAFWDFENFSTFSKNFFLDRRRRSANRVSLATRKSSIDRFRRFYNSSTLSRTHKSLLARTTPSTRYRVPIFLALVFPRLKETRPNQVKTGHLFENKFSYGHSPSLMRSLSDGERASQTVRAGEKT